MSRLALGPIQPSVQWVTGSFPWAESGLGIITTHLQLEPRLRMSATISSVPIGLHAIYRDNINFFYTQNYKFFWSGILIIILG